MNILAYGILSLISVNPCTGYELTQKLQLIWNAKHSQIYPLLALLEENGYVQFEHVAQTDKPDKKIYTITEAGQEEVRRWIDEPTSLPVMRDEFALKIYSSWQVEREGVKKLLAEREKMLLEKLDRLRKRQEELSLLGGAEGRAGGAEGKAGKEGGVEGRAGGAEGKAGKEGGAHDWPSPYFGASILVRKSMVTAEAELEWLRGIMESM